MEEELKITMGCVEWDVIRLRGERAEIKYAVSVMKEGQRLKDLNEEVTKLLKVKIGSFEDNDLTV